MNKLYLYKVYNEQMHVVDCHLFTYSNDYDTDDLRSDINFAECHSEGCIDTFVDIMAERGLIKITSN